MPNQKENDNPHAGCELNLTRLLNAPRELVWEVFANPAHIKNWWGPNGFTNTIFKMDLRTGGEWEFTMHGPDGADYHNHNVFTEVLKPERIVFEHVSPPKHFTTITLTAQGDKTLLNWHMLFESQEQFDYVVKTYKADGGLKQNVAKLEDYLAARALNKTNDKPLVFERVYNAPVSLLWETLTDGAALEKWFFEMPGFKPEAGHEFSFKRNKGEQLYEYKFKITEVVEGKKISYTWAYGGIPGSSLVTYELFPEGNKTKLRLTHEGLETFPGDNPHLQICNFETGWTQILGITLPDYLETSKQ
ncbi:MAG TPA: SRPBCC family protein, partial [Chitinophagales bacterium]|nr:SRPBCC family protein [Chitinophagales bacterium]